MLVFGRSVPLSSRAAETGLNVYNGYREAIRRFNDELGGAKIGDETYRLEVQMFYDISDPQRATALTQHQVDERMSYFLDSLSGTIVLPTAPSLSRRASPRSRPAAARTRPLPLLMRW